MEILRKKKIYVFRSTNNGIKLFHSKRIEICITLLNKALFFVDPCLIFEGLKF